ncbi:uncharacterized protein JCM15063_003359 [Sporobolomyces koalae]|uniref:uncharacterized protein n=1 Tax=Sporobolomyces koalae TaxID=500713 RepID=UPI00317919EA
MLPLTLPLIASVLLLPRHSHGQRTIVVENKCDYNVYPAVSAFPGNTESYTGEAGWEAPPGKKHSITVPSTWKGRIWARRGCMTNTEGLLVCVAGGCAGGWNCGEGALGESTAFELRLKSSTNAQYDVYNLQNGGGWSVPTRVKPQAKSCTGVECVPDLDGCPQEEMKLKDSYGVTLGCSSACFAHVGDSNVQCCTGDYGNSETCTPGMIIGYDYFKTPCKNSYAYFQDRSTTTVDMLCPSEGDPGFTLTFCPDGNGGKAPAANGTDVGSESTISQADGSPTGTGQAKPTDIPALTSAASVEGPGSAESPTSPSDTSTSSSTSSTASSAHSLATPATPAEEKSSATSDATSTASTFVNGEIMGLKTPVFAGVVGGIAVVGILAVVGICLCMRRGNSAAPAQTRTASASQNGGTNIPQDQEKTVNSNPAPAALHPSTLYPSADTPTLSLDNPTWSDPGYLARYRSASRHDVSNRASTSSTRAAPAGTGSPGNDNGNGNAQRSRRNRIANERLWSGGDYSPAIPLESYRAQTTRPKHALLFPGSGSQYVGMGHFLREKGKGKEVWAEAEDALAGFEAWRKSLRLDQLDGELGELGRMLDETEGLRRKEARMQHIVFDGPQDELTRSSNAQPAILITSIAFLRTLQSQLASSVVDSSSLVLGHSSGEYSAAVAAGALSFADGVRLTRLHGLLTHYALSLPSIGLSPELDAPAAQRGQMSALVLNPGRTHAEVTDIVRQVRTARPNREGSEGTVEVASFNSRSQVVLAGSRDGILRASELLKESEIASRAADLPVSAPFHCSFMKPAAGGMHHALTCGAVKLSTPSVPLVSGFDASLITSPSALVANLVDQISLPVRWSTCINALPTAHGIRRLVFLGPGQALANLARRDHKLVKEAIEASPSASQQEKEAMETEVVSVATEKDMDKLVEVWNAEQHESQVA